jgi:hypothetical protein
VAVADPVVLEPVPGVAPGPGDGIDALLGDLNRRARRSLAPGRAVRRAVTFDAADRRDPGWYPQGITWSTDAGRRVLVVAWYSRSKASRLTFLDLDTRRYRHVLLVSADGRPLHVHAGGLVWRGSTMHVAATGRGLVTADVSDLRHLSKSDPLASYGYRWVLPVRSAYRAVTEFRYSFVSYDTATSALLAGEYGGPDATHRLARFPLDPTGLLVLDPDGRARGEVTDLGVVRAQGAVPVDGRLYVTASHGTRVLGTVHAGGRAHRWAAPMGPEDLTWWPGTGLLWSVSEHPRRRWVFGMRPTWFD